MKVLVDWEMEMKELMDEEAEEANGAGIWSKLSYSKRDSKDRRNRNFDKRYDIHADENQDDDDGDADGAKDLDANDLDPVDACIDDSLYSWYLELHENFYLEMKLLYDDDWS